MIVVIDRIEEQMAICEELETERIISLNIKDLPEGVREGDVIRFEDGRYLFDLALTTERREKIINMYSRLF